MGDVSPPPDDAAGASGDASFDFDFINELFGARPSPEVPGCSMNSNQDVSLMQLGPFDPSLSQNGEMGYILDVLEKQSQGNAERLDFSLDPSVEIRGEVEEEGFFRRDECDRKNLSVEPPIFTYKSGLGDSSLDNSFAEMVAGADLVPSIKERLTYAMMYIKESLREGGVLVQMWVPVKRGADYVLTTCGQPFWLDHHIARLVNYREVSTNYFFSAVKDSKEAQGLPGRVFVGKVPEWTPDVRFFSSDEYPRVNFAQHYDVRGSVAVPVFEKGSHLCLGVVEVVMTREKINYDFDLESICSALQAVDLRTSEVASLPQIPVQVRNNLYHTALPEISEVLRVVCQKHKLPLAQTWIPCMQQGKRGSRHSDENYCHCVSTVDSACFIQDASVWGFHKACSEHHLFVGQGLVGHAFTTNQPCFSPDVTNLSKTRYPLSHHARIFNLHGAVAIRLRSINTGTTDFVLEFFLPPDCIDSEMQKQILNSLSTTMQEVCRTLRVVTEKELTDEKPCLASNTVSPEEHKNEVVGEGQTSNWQVAAGGPVEIPEYHNQEAFQFISKDIEGQLKEKELSMPGKGMNHEECDILKFGVVLQGIDTEMLSMDELLSNFINTQEDLPDAVNIDVASPTCELGSDKEIKRSKKKRGKAEKVISLHVLRQHFAGSLKDAAKSLGVCPTTLKRICRAHGITRWPSRKIKKVGNSLQKLQRVIDSVQGVEGSSELNALYSKLSSSDLVAQTAKETNGLFIVTPSDQKLSDGEDGLENIHSADSNPSSSSSRGCDMSHSSSSSSRQEPEASNILVKNNAYVDGHRAVTMKRTPTGTELNQLVADPESSEAKSKAKKIQNHRSNYVGLLRVKAICGDDMVRLKLQPNWGLQDLKLEIAKRFNISDADYVNLKYLDDDSEWVLLTCDADLHECLDVHMGSSLNTVKISVHFCEAKRT